MKTPRTEKMLKFESFMDGVGIVETVLTDEAEFLEKENIRLREIMEACASIAGKDWLWSQLALAEALDGNFEGFHYKWAIELYKRMKEEN